MRTTRKTLPMVEPLNFTRYTYNCDGVDYTFAQLCCHFGLKYGAVWWRVRYNGMTVHEAITDCMKDPHCWGVTFSNGSLPVMNEAERAEYNRKRTATWRKTMTEKGLIK